MSIKIKYKLTGTGWAEAKFVMPRKTIKIEISYLCNPLPELIKGILDITKSKKEFVEVLFSHEPGETKLQIVKLSKTELQISFYHYPEGTFPSQLSYSFDKSKKITYPSIKIQDYNFLGSYQININEFANAIKDAITNLLLLVTISEYKAIWTMPFPTVAYKKFLDICK